MHAYLQPLRNIYPPTPYVKGLFGAACPKAARPSCPHMCSTPAGALKEFDGAIVAITHNRAFAESLNAT